MPTGDESREIFLVTGPSGAAKSTVARLLATRFRRGVHVEGDLFRRSILAGRLDMTPRPSAAAPSQLRLRYRLAATVADAYFEDGFTVVLEDVVAGPLLPRWAALIKGRPLHVVVLMPSIETVAARDESRSHSGYTDFSLPELYQAFLAETPRMGTWLDTSDQTPDQTVDAIFASVRTVKPRRDVVSASSRPGATEGFDDERDRILDDALSVAVEAHRGQLYPAPDPQPFILHPLRVMLGVTSRTAQIVALLHDVVEDSELTLRDLEDRGFDGRVVGAVECLTRREGEAYAVYIGRVATDPTAREVKLSDLADNLANNRALPPTDETRARIEQYQRAQRQLSGDSD